MKMSAYNALKFVNRRLQVCYNAKNTSRRPEERRLEMLSNYTMSFASNGSPHSGQNFGGLVGSSGSQPHLSHL